MLALGTAPTPTQALARGAALVGEGDYAGARAVLLAQRDARHPAHDYLLYFLGQAAYYAGDRPTALDAFHRLAAWKDSRLAALAAWREADTLYVMGRGTDAARAYENLRKRGVAGGEPAVVDAHMAEAPAAAGRKDVALAVFRRVFVDYPTHPLADQAMRRMQEIAGKSPLVS